MAVLCHCQVNSMMTAVMRIKKNRNRESDQKKMISAPISNKPIAGREPAERHRINSWQQTAFLQS
jgi:hypothetical protein